MLDYAKHQLLKIHLINQLQQNSKVIIKDNYYLMFYNCEWNVGGDIVNTVVSELIDEYRCKLSYSSEKRIDGSVTVKVLPVA
jgi:hypothetical protein